MTRRSLYIAAYDVANPKRLRKMRGVVKSFSIGGQKSVAECLLTSAEWRELAAKSRSLIDTDEDHFALLRIEERTRPLLYGAAAPPTDPDFYYIG